MDRSITTRPVRDSDDPFLFRLFSSTRAREMELVPWTDQQKTEFLLMQFTAQRNDYAGRFPTSVHEIITSGDIDVGRWWVNTGPQEIRLLDITIDPDRRNEGIGQAMIERLQHEAQAAGMPLRHSVASENIHALRFYERNGFRVVEEFEVYRLMEWVER